MQAYLECIGSAEVNATADNARGERSTQWELY